MSVDLQNAQDLLNKLKKLSINYPDEYLVIKLFASIYFKKLDWKNAIKSYEKLILFEKEKDYIDAVSIYFKDWQNLDTQTRKLNYERKMEELYIKYPDDVETAVFYSLSVLATADLNDKTYSKQKKSGKIQNKSILENKEKSKRKESI